jgi:DNA polymerase III epsilon subunit-like protein
MIMFKPDPAKVKYKYFRELPRIYLDIETSGLKVADGAVILSAAFIFQQQELDKPMKDSVVDKLEVVIKPTEEEWSKASPEALKVNGMTLEYLEKYGVSLEEATAKIVRWLFANNVPALNKSSSTKVFCVGQNPKFDIGFLKHFMGGSLEFVGFPFDDVVDNIEMFKSIQKYDTTLRTKNNKYNGHAISQALGVQEEDKVHTAMGGAEVVFRNYWAIHDRFNSVISKYRQEVLAENYSNAYSVPEGATHLEEFKKVAKKLGWQSLGSIAGPHVFVDSDGQRLSYFAGTPPILVKL